MNYENYRNAFSEVSLILNNSSVSIKNKIPKSFYDFLEKNKNEKYIPNNIDIRKPETLSRDTRILISVIYRNYICDKEEKKRLLEEDAKAIVEFQKKSLNIFKNKEIEVNNKEVEESHKELVPIENSVFNKIMNKIKTLISKIFHR